MFHGHIKKVGTISRLRFTAAMQCPFAYVPYLQY